MANPYITNARAIALLNALVDDVDTSGAGELRIYGGTPPADADAAEESAGNTLAVITLNDPAFGDASDDNHGATVDLDTTGGLSDTSANNSGTANHCRIYNGGGTCVLQGDCTVTGGGGFLQLDSVSITAGQTVNLTGMTLTLAEQLT